MCAVGRFVRRDWLFPFSPQFGRFAASVCLCDHGPRITRDALPIYGTQCHAEMSTHLFASEYRKNLMFISLERS